MKKIITRILCATAALTSIITQPYTVNASNFTKPRAKTLRRIAKNLGLAVAIDRIYLHPAFTPDQQILLKSIPSFISNKFTPQSIVQLKNGERLSIKQALQLLKQLETILAAIIQDPTLKEANSFEMVLKSAQRLTDNLDKIV